MLWTTVYESALAVAIRTTWYLYAFVLSSHIVLIALLAGSSITLCILRRRQHLRGAPVATAEPSPSATQVPRLWIITAAAAVATGLLLFVSNPFGYIDNPIFLAKMPLVAMSITVTWVGMAYGRLARLRTLRVLVYALWPLTIGAGRLIAFF